MFLLPKATAKTDVLFTQMQQTTQQVYVMFCWVKQRKCEVCGKHNHEDRNNIRQKNNNNNNTHRGNQNKRNNGDFHTLLGELEQVKQSVQKALKQQQTTIGKRKICDKTQENLDDEDTNGNFNSEDTFVCELDHICRDIPTPSLLLCVSVRGYPREGDTGLSVRSMMSRTRDWLKTKPSKFWSSPR